LLYCSDLASDEAENAICKDKTYIETSPKTLSEDIYKALSECKNKYQSIDIVVENNGLKTVLNTIDIKQ